MNEQKIYDFLKGKGFTEAGIFGIMGNLKAESGCNPRNLQNSYEKKLGYTDDTYTEAVDSGAYNNFVRDAAGYGLAQWTYHTRKENLLKFARQNGESIGSLDMQLEFMYQELQGYKSLFALLVTSESIREVSDAFMTQYEKPADQSEAAKSRRASYGEEMCNMLAGSGSSDSGTEITEAQVRQRVVSVAVSWYGRKEADGSHQVIIDLYNKHIPLARGYRVKYTDSWCATFGSAVAIKAGYTDIIPLECGCGQMIELFRELGRWVENDAYVPEPGDYIFYDWGDNGAGDNTGWPEHVGIVVSVSRNAMKIIEGNKDDAVSYRKITINSRYIRGYGVPDYASKATAVSGDSSGDGGNTASSRSCLCMTPQWVGEVTADSLNVRKWAGKEYDKIKSWPSLAEGNLVDVCDKVNAADGSVWYYIRIGGRIYGFVHSDYIKQTGNQDAAGVKKDQVVSFTGCTHYTGSNTVGAGKRCKPGKAKVTAINTGSKHPYHLVAVPGSGCTVYGWVNADDIET